MAVFSFLRKVLIISGTGEIGYLGPKQQFWTFLQISLLDISEIVSDSSY